MKNPFVTAISFRAPFVKFPARCRLHRSNLFEDRFYSFLESIVIVVLAFIPVLIGN